MHPRVTLFFFRLIGLVPAQSNTPLAMCMTHDCCTHNHRRKGLPDLAADMEQRVHINSPWPYQLSQLYYEPVVTAAGEKSRGGINKGHRVRVSISYGLI
jgi:hypothetical protein